MIGAKVICDSVSPQGIRLTTMQVKLHRFVLAELNTHRMFSRNFRSSRAVPVRKLLDEVRNDPAMPVFWGKNISGMQAVEELDNTKLTKAVLNEYDESIPATELGLVKVVWRNAAKAAAAYAASLSSEGLHKQIANRVLEPFLYVHGIVTATEWDNFFGLRLHKDAQPEFRVLAEAMWKARQDSTPTLLRPGEWHLPYIGSGDEGLFDVALQDFDMDKVRKVSVARCARVSYNSFDTGKRSTVEEDLRLYDKIMGQQPLHASPAEHQATPDEWADEERINSVPVGGCWYNSDQHGNFRGWRQYRKMLQNEAVAPLPEGYAP